MINSQIQYLFFFICTFSIPNFLSAQTHFPRKEGRIVYEKVDSLKGFSKEQLFGFSKKWFTDTFRNSKAVIQTEDFETGLLIGKGETSIVSPELLEKKFVWNDFVSGLYQFTIQIEVKNQKYRIRIYDISKHYLSNVYDGSKIFSPLEELDLIFNDDKKKAERWKTFSPVISDNFNSLMKSFSSKATEIKNDDF